MFFNLIVRRSFPPARWIRTIVLTIFTGRISAKHEVWASMLRVALCLLLSEWQNRRFCLTGNLCLIQNKYIIF